MTAQAKSKAQRRAAPTHFLAIRLPSPDLARAGEAVQQACVADSGSADTHLAVVNVKKLHLTLFVLTVQDADGLALVRDTLAACAADVTAVWGTANNGAEEITFSYVCKPPPSSPPPPPPSLPLPLPPPSPPLPGLPLECGAVAAITSCSSSSFDLGPDTARYGCQNAYDGQTAAYRSRADSGKAWASDGEGVGSSLLKYETMCVADACYDKYAQRRAVGDPGRR